MPCYYEGSLNDSGVTVNKCTRDSWLKSQSANNTGSMRFVSVVHDSGVTVNKCTRDSWLKSQSANNTGSMRFVSVVHDYRRRLNESLFQPGQRFLFLMPINSVNTMEKKPLLAGNSKAKRSYNIVSILTELRDTQESEFFRV